LAQDLVSSKRGRLGHLKRNPPEGTGQIILIQATRREGGGTEKERDGKLTKNGGEAYGTEHPSTGGCLNECKGDSSNTKKRNKKKQKK